MKKLNYEHLLNQNQNLDEIIEKINLNGNIEHFQVVNLPITNSILNQTGIIPTIFYITEE